jgi:hypothetical protein
MMCSPRRRPEPRWCRLVAAFAILIAALSAGCRQGPARPAWVDQPGLARPAAFYLTAVGAGASRDAAADAALARLAQQIAVDVDARETAQSTYVADEGGARASARQRVRLDRSIDLDTAVLLAGSVVVETWQGPQGDVYALAVLDRAAAASFYDGLMRRLAEQVRAEQAVAAESVSAWSRFVHLGRALAAAEEHDRLHRIRSVVSPWPSTARGARALAPEIAAARTAARHELVAVVEPAPGTPAVFAPIVRDALLAAGIAVRPQASPTVRARVSYEAIARPFARRQDHVVEWRLTVQFVDGVGGRAPEGLTLDGDGWGTKRPDASAAAVHRARDHLRRELAPYLQGLVSPAGKDLQSDAS